MLDTVGLATRHRHSVWEFGDTLRYLSRQKVLLTAVFPRNAQTEITCWWWLLGPLHVLSECMRKLGAHRKSRQKFSETNKISFTWNPLRRSLPETNKSSHFRLQLLRPQCIQNTIWSPIFLKCDFFSKAPTHPNEFCSFYYWASANFCDGPLYTTGFHYSKLRGEWLRCLGKLRRAHALTVLDCKAQRFGCCTIVL